MEQTKVQKTELKKSCINCGAEMLYAPGSTNLKCDYCGHTEGIEISESGFQELELHQYLNQLGAQSYSEEISLLNCKSCGATQHVELNYKSLHCVYCSSPLIISDLYKEEWILPGAVLPFQITEQEAFQKFRQWVKSLWFAPNKLQKASLDPENTKGLYVPYWTFDAQLKATYTGERGEYYYVTKTIGSGNNRRRVQQRKTMWRAASGKISGFIDDTLIKASHQKKAKIPAKIEHWNLDLLEPFQTEFLSGFVTEKYTIPLKEGHLQSKEEANHIARRWIHQDIGGDAQRIHRMEMELSEETFKHILLPVYVSAYIYNGKRYNFFINGQTGIVSGKRPYSFWKIFFLALFIVITILILTLLTSG